MPEEETPIGVTRTQYKERVLKTMDEIFDPANFGFEIDAMKEKIQQLIDNTDVRSSNLTDLVRQAFVEYKAEQVNLHPDAIRSLEDMEKNLWQI